MKLYDAHNHLSDPRLDPVRNELVAALKEIGLCASVVNGTCEDDWTAVAAAAKEHSWTRPSFGLHPWYVAKRTASWHAQLLEMLDANPRAAVGEVGLDRWIEGYDFPAQTEVFRAQLATAADRNLPVAIHCLKAWGALWEIVSKEPVPGRGFLLHSYGGPAEMVDGFVKRGGYFSFSPYFLNEKKERQREVFRDVPLERPLVETDAPDMPPPGPRNPRPLRDPTQGTSLNHPANLDVAYAGLAEIRGLAVNDLAECVEENYLRLFGA